MEPEWDEQEQGWILALAAYRSTRCPNCGRDIDECTAAGAEGQFTAEHRRCHATTSLLIAQEAYRENPQPSALMWATRRKR